MTTGFFPTTSEQWAAWVQAIGSVFAILAAVFIAKHQTEKNDRIQYDLRIQKYVEMFGPPIAIIEAVIESFEATYQKARDELAAGMFMVGDTFYIKSDWLIEAFEAIPAHSLGGPIPVKSLLRSRDLMRESRVALNDIGIKIDNLITVTQADEDLFHSKLKKLEVEKENIRSALLEAIKPL